MKTNTYYLIAILAIMTFAFSACDSDDDNSNGPYEQPSDMGEFIAGDYTGIMNTEFSSTQSPTINFGDSVNQEVIIRHDSLNHVTVTYNNWNHAGVNYGNLIISPVTVMAIGTQGVYAISGSCKQILYKEGRGFEANLTVNGTISGNNRQNNMIFTVDMPVSPAMTLNFKLTYNGQPE